MKNFNEVFHSSDLNEQSFYLTSSFEEQEKNEIIQAIMDYNGVSFYYNYIIIINLIKQKYAFSFTEKTILVIKDVNSLIKLGKDELKEIDTIYLYDNNHTEKLKSERLISNPKKEERIIRIITAKTLREELNYFYKNKFGYFLIKNLPINANKYTTLAVILKNRNYEEKIFFHVFNNSKKEILNDIPFFHRNAPDGYSFFCSGNEFSQLIKFLKKNKNNKKLKQIQQEILESEPAPHKKHYVCQICKIKFENYLEHIHSKLHDKNKLNFTNAFLRMKNTFKRIVKYNKEKNENKEILSISSYKKNKDEIKEKIKSNGKENSSSNISDNIQNDITKCDSLFNENKKSNNIRNKKLNNNGSNYTETSSKKQKKSKEISVEDIKAILNSIKCRPVINIYYQKKRKSNVLKNNIFNENYIYDFKKITGKIYHFNSLLDKNNH